MGDITLIPDNHGQRCPGHEEFCDECDYLICCTNAYGLCGQCFEDNGTCPLGHITTAPRPSPAP